MMLKTTPTKQAPGPTGLELARWMYRTSQNAFQTFVETARDHRPVARVPFRPGRAWFILSSPDAAKYVLQDNHRNYKKGMTYEFIKPVVGEGLLTSEGDFWLRQRRLVAPMFHRERVNEWAEMMVQLVDEMLHRWSLHPPDEPLDVSAEMAQLTLSIAGKLLFNKDIGKESAWIGDDMLLIFRDLNRRITHPLTIPRRVPTPHNRRVNAAIQRLEDMVYGLIDERRGNEEEYDDLLSTFMLAEDADSGERMSDKQVRDEVMTFVLAGHETTSNHLSWTLYLLSKHPRVRRRLQQEVDDGVDGQIPTLKELKNLDYLEQVIDESLRLYPPAWTVDREPIEDDEIEGFDVPAGSLISVGPYFVHHNPDVWTNPEGFDPDRFGPGGDAPDHRYAHFPFGGGPRMCVGADFAILEAKLILATITRRFQLDLIPGHGVVPEATVTLYPRDGIPMLVKRR